MITKARIEFKKQRDIGEIFSDTFAFLRDEYKSYFGVIFKIIGPYFLIAMTGMGLYIYSFGSLMNSQFLKTGNINTSPYYAILGVLLLLVGGIAVYVLSYAVTLHYIKSYENNNGIVKEEEIRAGVKDDFWNITGLGVLNGIMISIGVMLCCIPGIYIWVPLTLSFSLLVFKNVSITDAISDSFSLVKDEWLMTFITMLVVWLVISIASYAFTMPSVIYLYIKMGISMSEIDVAGGDSFMADPIYLGLMLISYFFQYLLSLVTVISSAIIYFHLNEKKNFTGTFEKINTLGNNLDN